MTFLKPLTLCFGLALLAACGASDRIAVQSPPVAEKIRIGFASVEVKDVSLPSYAAADEIAQQAADGTIVSSGVQWGDAPERAIGLEISRNLARMSGRRVAPEPWPFEEEASAALDVRFIELIAGMDGIFRANGQYFVGVFNGRERSGLFDLTVAYDPKGGPAAIARARGQIVLDLTAFIARNGLR
ncbi:membrane integrity-associated transporter subunit PqiC [Sulfitobacter albidus]|uniref:Membrane integrity-associated transporter subunit PqiC n=1 Tax=Sulfitobacter albidus TaxID=2829501 RepID=A0A975JCG7_9RHOB|nr:ABC-type transport auxiliary lipoprotein family protein [Sulfitobacter albidus]QUJ75939.1 membrane integrity-associated transporter subunit PqiC [Sulfitobacter albidus]